MADASGPRRRRGTALAATLAALTAAGATRGATPPLPPPRPADLRPGVEVPAEVPLPIPRPEADGPALPPPAVSPPGAPPRPTAETSPGPAEPDLACAPLLAGGKVSAQAAPAVAGPGGCGIASPVVLAAVLMRDGRRVDVVPPALMRCDLADRFADWLRDDVATLAGDQGDLLGVADAAAYACRTRNGLAGATISEHARGDAIDVSAFRFARRTVAVQASEAADIWSRVKPMACRRFETVLGPGSDRYHAAVLHLDLARRHGGFRVCQWDP